jgi:purine-binding chemotaxis protein CheW
MTQGGALEGRTLVRRAARGRVATPAAREQVLLFRVGEGLYGIGIRGLWEVLSPEGITSLPTPQYEICTVLAYRGRRLPLVRLGELFGVSADTVSSNARVLLTQGRGTALGLLVDEVLEVVDIDPQRIAPMPAMASMLSPALFRGLVDRDDRVIILLSGDGLGDMAEVAHFSDE